jgi:hypothetical protein
MSGLVCLISLGITSPEKEFTEESLTPVVLVDTVCSNIPFLLDSLCYIADEFHSLDAFLDELELLLQGKDTIVKILHIGDSHIQAGFYTGQVMRLLQETFGNAGRGWIAPYKLAKVNEPLDYFIQSSIVKDWTIGRCIQKDPDCPWGPGGIALQTPSNFVDFKIRISPKRGVGYEFNEVHLFRDKEAVPLLPIGADCDMVKTVWGVKKEDFNVVIDTFRISAQIDSLRFHTVLKNELPEESLGLLKSANRYYGFSLMNGNPGILYHSVGHNGAMFVNYINRDFIHQLSLFEPSLLIVSLGTNEAFGNRFREEEFESQMNDCIRLIKEYMPNTAILLTTPAECYQRVRNKGYQRNVNVAKVAKTISEYAQKEGLACFDLYKMTGGQNSCEKWYKSSFYGKDRIHFTINGYEEQGKLLYKSLIRLKVDKQNG